MTADDHRRADSAAPYRLEPHDPSRPGGLGAVDPHATDEWEGVFDSLTDAVTIHDEHFNIIRANASAQRLLGIRPGDSSAATKCFRQYHGTDAPPANCQSCECIQTLRPETAEVFEPHLNMHLEIRAVPRIAKDGRCIGVIHVVRDVTERRRVEAALLGSEERFRRAFMTGLDACCIVRLEDGIFVECNEEYERLFGYSRDEVVGRTSLELRLYAESANRSRAFADLKAIGHVRDVEFHGRRKNGDSVICSLSENVVPIDGVPHVLTVIRNVTEQRRIEDERSRLQAELQQAQKMESVGRLAGGVAHDFNNMLSVILGYAEAAAENAEPGSTLHADLLEIQNAAERSANLTRQLLAFARKQTVAPRVLDVNETVGGMFKMLRRLIGENIDLTWRPGVGVPPVHMDPGQIDQVLANLCVNARDAIAGGGRVVIETDEASIDEAYCDNRPGMKAGDYVRLMVSDTGSGMSAETVTHIFEPFFTTKAPGEGTGLGLATVYGIVKQNNGFVDVYSELGHGTTFTIYLPRYCGETEARVESDRCELVSRDHGTVLVVEDEPSILKLHARTLEALGYHVLTAQTPGEAIRAAESHAGEIDLLITDVVMPEMNGRDLSRWLTAMHPRMKCLFASGYTADIIVHHGVLDEGVHFIQKPCTKKALAAKIRGVLSQA
jgi:PAS domain S-box-containing protein